MHIQEQEPLSEHTTLRVGGPAQYLATAHSPEDIERLLRVAHHEQLPTYILGSGSNVLAPDDGVRGMVLQMKTSQVTMRFLDHGKVRLVADAGVTWDELVSISVEQELWGIENLSGIPGTVGAAPIQNIGAYGTEFSDVCLWIEVFDTQTLSLRRLSSEECIFAYRDSVFKHTLGNNYIVTKVAIQLEQNKKPNLDYTDLKNTFPDGHVSSSKEVRETVLSIRSQKFPDMSIFGTAGSFFKNPVISQSHFEELQKEYPDIPGYRVGEENIKVPLAWILDYVCGLKGYTNNFVSLHTEQPLVLVTHKHAREHNVHAFAEHVGTIVKKTTNIVIEREVQALQTKKLFTYTV